MRKGRSRTESQGTKKPQLAFSSTRGARDILCPFFRRHDETEIRCEGVQDGMTIGNVFCSPKRKKAYQLDYCEKDYQKCMICRMLMRDKYGM